MALNISLRLQACFEQVSRKWLSFSTAFCDLQLGHSRFWTGIFAYLPLRIWSRFDLSLIRVIPFLYLTGKLNFVYISSFEKVGGLSFSSSIGFVSCLHTSSYSLKRHVFTFWMRLSCFWNDYSLHDIVINPPSPNPTSFIPTEMVLIQDICWRSYIIHS